MYRNRKIKIQYQVCVFVYAKWSVCARHIIGLDCVEKVTFILCDLVAKYEFDDSLGRDRQFAIIKQLFSDVNNKDVSSKC